MLATQCPTDAQPGYYAVAKRPMIGTRGRFEDIRDQRRPSSDDRTASDQPSIDLPVWIAAAGCEFGSQRDARADKRAQNCMSARFHWLPRKGN